MYNQVAVSWKLQVFRNQHIIQAEIRSQDSEEVKIKIVEIVHSIFVDVENFLTHESFTSLPGGFKIAINGIHIFKVTN